MAVDGNDGIIWCPEGQVDVLSSQAVSRKRVPRENLVFQLGESCLWDPKTSMTRESGLPFFRLLP